MRGWKSVRSLPDGSEIVEVKLEDGTITRARYVRVNWKGDYGEWWISEDRTKDPLFGVTHWRIAPTN